MIPITPTTTERADLAIRAMFHAQNTAHARAARRRAFPLPYFISDIEDMLTRAVRGHRYPWQLWGPRAMVAMGMEAREIAMLQAADLECHHDRWFLHVQRGPRGALRGLRHRTIPIPQCLEDVGFVAFIQAAQDGPLFPELARATRPGSALGAWVRECAVSEDGRPVRLRAQDLRQACARALHNDGADPYTLNAFMGRPISAMMTKMMGRFYAWGDPLMLLCMVDQTMFPAMGGVPRMVPRHDS